MTQSIYKKRFLKRPIYKKPCNHAGCDKVIHTRSFNRKFCYRHGANFKYKISKMSMDKRKLGNSPYTKSVQKIRKCLKCRNDFESLSDYNRVCTRCNSENDQIKTAAPFHGWTLKADTFVQPMKYGEIL